MSRALSATRLRMNGWLKGLKRIGSRLVAHRSLLKQKRRPRPAIGVIRLIPSRDVARSGSGGASLTIGKFCRPLEYLQKHLVGELSGLRVLVRRVV